MDRSDGEKLVKYLKNFWNNIDYSTTMELVTTEYMLEHLYFFLNIDYLAPKYFKKDRWIHFFEDLSVNVLELVEPVIEKYNFIPIVFFFRVSPTIEQSWIGIDPKTKEGIYLYNLDPKYEQFKRFPSLLDCLVDRFDIFSSRYKRYAKDYRRGWVLDRDIYDHLLYFRDYITENRSDPLYWLNDPFFRSTLPKGDKIIKWNAPNFYNYILDKKEYKKLDQYFSFITKFAKDQKKSDEYSEKEIYLGAEIFQWVKPDNGIISLPETIYQFIEKREEFYPLFYGGDIWFFSDEKMERAILINSKGDYIFDQDGDDGEFFEVLEHHFDLIKFYYSEIPVLDNEFFKEMEYDYIYNGINKVFKSVQNRDENENFLDENFM